MSPSPNPRTDQERLAASNLLTCLLATCAAVWLLGFTTLRTAAGVFAAVVAVIAAFAFLHSTAGRKGPGGQP